MKPRVVIFAKAPVAGAVKTRLIPALGALGAARLAERMLRHTLACAFEAGGCEVELCAHPAVSEPAWADVALPAQLITTTQGEGDLGERMARAARRVLTSQPVILIGTDCPEISPQHLHAAAQSLQTHAACLHPTADGGYALLGLRDFHASIFEGIAWSTATVAAETLSRIHRLGWSLKLGDTLRDIDEPGDLIHLPDDWQRT